jgi:hypothetical protein
VAIDEIEPPIDGLVMCDPISKVVDQGNPLLDLSTPLSRGQIGKNGGK